MNLEQLKQLLNFKNLYDKINGDKWLQVFKDLWEKFPTWNDVKSMFDGIFLKDFIKTKWAWIAIAIIACVTFSAVYFAFFAGSSQPTKVTQPPTGVKPVYVPKREKEREKADFPKLDKPVDELSPVEKHCLAVIRQYDKLWVERVTGQLIDQELLREYSRCRRILQ